MAKKKFGKFLLFSAAVGAVAAGAYYYFQSKEKISNDDFDEDDDFDDFSDNLDSNKVNHSDTAERSYVSLDMDNKEEPAPDTSPSGETSAESSNRKADNNNTETKDALSGLEKAAESAKAKIEEFFDEDDDDGYDGN